MIDMPPYENSNRHTIIAWQGWQMPMGKDWRPLKIDGDYHDGFMIIGDQGGPVLQIRWERPKKAGPLTGGTWLEEKCRRLAVLPEDNPPHPAGFDRVAWVKNVLFRQGVRKTLWWGWSASDVTAMEVMTTSLRKMETNRHVMEELIPHLTVFNPGEDWRWRLYRTSFKVPGTFRLFRQHLFLGDVALMFQRGAQENMMVRQVYPADLALSRRSMDQWLLQINPFPHRRIFRKTDETGWQTEDRANLFGTIQAGIKSAPFPFNRVAPRRCCKMIAKDLRLDRLLMAEHMLPIKGEGFLCEKTVLEMNEDVG